MLALDGIRVLELCEHTVGPLAAQNLADFGANVVKVESSPSGDAMRSLDSAVVENGYASAYFVSMNRNKRSICIDLMGGGSGLEVLHRLIEQADVLLHSYQSKDMHRLGLAYDDLADRYPRLIYGAVSGFDNIAPDKAGQDLLAQCVSGLAYTTGTPGIDASLNPSAQVEYAASSALAQGILAALYEREHSGRGQEVCVNLVDTALAMQMVEVAARTMYGRDLNRKKECYSGTFSTSDGLVTVVGHFCENPLRLICLALGIDDLSLHPELATSDLQARNNEFANAILAPVVAELETREVLDRFGSVDLPCAPHLTLEEALRHPQVAANSLIHEVDVAGQGQALVVGHPVQLSRGFPRSTRRGVPALGQDTHEVLAEIGFTVEEIELLSRGGAVRTATDLAFARYASNFV
ncbi:CoA transferase [Pseudonocardia sp. C8]|uniref:CaiB/BaiF CoA transferase family protein n=1 Tax=Pseudonocardia sp. C8 TaxID=2762759 RepID=UPI001642911F|nr:CoA transferase [Pseudonocardia sp. C8]MBC3189554.1 CoA transferase [Pseudonocardia sp. C8]